ncbi:MAG: ATP-binding protein [Thermoplasmata archaeon]|nr:MAG: ATP-binding protein [Thermoplasmata archaeon]KAA0009416.1 MAG: ATP-binding protein [Thermoplasmata archaeon]
MEKVYILGRRNGIKEGVLRIGRYYAIDGSLGSDVYLDGLKPHVILICGKRGYGKSYTMATIIEEMAMMEENLKKNIGVVIIDTLGIFWTMAFPNKKQEEELKKWKMDAKGIDIKIFSSPENVEEYKKKGIPARELVMKTSELAPYHWAQLFGLSLKDYVMAVIARAIDRMKGDYSLNDLINEISKDEKVDERTKAIAENFLNMAKSWNLFGKDGIEIKDIVKGGKISIIDLSPYGEEIKVVITAIIARKIFEARVKERKKYEEALLKGGKIKEEVPITWLAIDEAHVFLPNEKSISKDVLIKQWMRQGRQPGVALLLATQRVASMDEEVLSHADIIISHRLTAQDDIDALNKVRPTYMHESIGEAVRRIGEERGVAVIIDDVSESMHVIKVRPRMSWHGGEEPSAKH